MGRRILKAIASIALVTIGMVECSPASLIEIPVTRKLKTNISTAND